MSDKFLSRQTSGKNAELKRQIDELKRDIEQTIPIDKGGTGITQYTASGDLLHSSSNNNLTKLTLGTQNQFLKVGPSNAPIWSDLPSTFSQIVMEDASNTGIRFNHTDDDGETTNGASVKPIRINSVNYIEIDSPVLKGSNLGYERLTIQGYNYLNGGFKHVFKVPAGTNMISSDVAYTLPSSTGVLALTTDNVASATKIASINNTDIVTLNGEQSLSKKTFSQIVMEDANNTGIQFNHTDANGSTTNGASVKPIRINSVNYIELDSPVLTGANLGQERLIIRGFNYRNNGLKHIFNVPLTIASDVSYTLPATTGVLALTTDNVASATKLASINNTDIVTLNGEQSLTKKTFSQITIGNIAGAITNATTNRASLSIGTGASAGTDLLMDNTTLKFNGACDVGTEDKPARDYIGRNVFMTASDFNASGTAIFSHPQNGYNTSSTVSSAGYNMRSYLYATGTHAGSLLFDNMSWGFSGSTGGTWIAAAKITPRSSSNYVPMNLMNFTGQHRCCTEDASIIDDVEQYVGMIVYATGVYDSIVPDVLGTKSPIQDDYIDGVNVGKYSPAHEIEQSTDKVTVDEAQPVIALSTTKNDKRVYGIISGREEGDERNFSVGSFSTSVNGKIVKRRLFINSLGEGGIKVCNQNGNIQNGDLLVSSDVKGMAMRQNDDVFRSYTIAKATQDYTFQTDTEYPLIGCTYHCG